MPRFCANLSLMFNERPFLERFEAAARAGFTAVEYQFPYDFDAGTVAECARAAGVEVVLFNLPAGDWAAGERGIACQPGREAEFRDGVARALRYAEAAGCRRLNMLAGLELPRAHATQADMQRTYISNLRHAARELQQAGVALMIEPLNTRTVPGAWLCGSVQALALLDEAGAGNAWLQYDVFHMQIMEGDLAATIAANLDRIGHVQVADVPDRHEPGTGEINFPWLLEHLDSVGYRGWVGAEYIPSRRTEDSLAWLHPWLGARDSMAA